MGWGRCHVYGMDPKTRQRALSEWRGYWEPRPRPERQKMVGEVLPDLMKKLGLGERYSEQEMQEAWIEIVGEFLSNHSRPVGLSNGVLQVMVEVSVIHYDLDRKWRPIILEKMRERFGRNTIRDIRFVLS